ncbi:MAG: DUF4011 domain-containing protein, partial [Cytophagales bacterium]|nr:DUF4011 domain-containing protein [Armatimonadota bacterium]
MSKTPIILPPPSRSSAGSVQDTIAGWKASLLDLTNRNPLVALPADGVVDLPAPNDVYEPLLRRRKPLTFWDLQNKAMDRTVLRDSGNYPARAAAWATFRHLHLQALSLLQGQDVNALYVVFGTLAWTQPGTGKVIRSPLLLVPVTLERRADGTAYSILRSQEEDVEVNPVLAHRLALPDVGISLPPSPEEAYLIPSSFLRKVTTLVEAWPDWEVEEKTCLGLFPLLKMRLYEDLVAQQEKATQHPLVAALAGNLDALEALPTVTLPASAETEQGGSEGTQHQLLDADPAQQRAILAAVRGQSFVLQGPPGTGKTQTITNIISECIAANKSVLLVSGRMASLDAVLRRLNDKGLGDLCLAAHSLKTSKRDILAQLEQGLNAPAAKGGGKTAKKDLEALDDLRRDLDAFARELHQKRALLALSVYEANGIVAESEAAQGRDGATPPLPFVVENPLLISTSQLEAIESLVEKSATHPSLAGAAESSLWNGAFTDPNRADLPAEANRVLQAVLMPLSRLEAVSRALAEQLSVAIPLQSSETDRLLQIAGTIRTASDWE